MDSPEIIKKSVERNTYLIQEHDISGRIRYAIFHKYNKIEVPYIICETLEKELKKVGYTVRTDNHFFWGSRTFIEW